MTYKDQLCAAMTKLGEDPKTIIVGYNTTKAGGNCAGTVKDFPQDRIIEMPLAENLMFGAAIGLSLDGWIPIVWLERMDFLCCGMDAVVNHLDKIQTLSKGIHKPAAILRMVIGNSRKPLFTGPTHVQDFSAALSMMVDFPVRALQVPSQIGFEYESALARAKQGESTALCEYKDFYEDNV